MHEDIGKRVVDKYAQSLYALLQNVVKEDHIAKDDMELQSALYFSLANILNEEGKKLGNEVLGIKDDKISKC